MILTLLGIGAGIAISYIAGASIARAASETETRPDVQKKNAVSVPHYSYRKRIHFITVVFTILGIVLVFIPFTKNGIASQITVSEALISNIIIFILSLIGTFGVFHDKQSKIFKDYKRHFTYQMGIPILSAMSLLLLMALNNKYIILNFSAISIFATIGVLIEFFILITLNEKFVTKIN